MIKKISIFLLVFLSCFFVGCNTINDESESNASNGNDSENNDEDIYDDGPGGSDEDIYDGGPDSLVVGKYYFDSFDKYNEFYEIFCDYNKERYVMPKNNDSVEFTYSFEGLAGIEDIHNKRYDIEFRFPAMYFEVINITDYEVKFQVFDIGNEYNDVYNSLSQIRYIVNTDKFGYSKSISIYVGDMELARSCYVSILFIQDENFSAIMDKIIFAISESNASNGNDSENNDEDIYDDGSGGLDEDIYDGPGGSDQGIIDDGPGGLVVGDYFFDNFDKFNEFYEIFCDYNQERYVVPKNNDSIDFIYHFVGLASLDDIERKRIDIEFQYPDMYFEVLNITDYEVKFQVFDIANEYNDVYNSLSQIRYIVNTGKFGYSKYISICVGDTELARSYYVSILFIQDENFSAIMDKIIFAFNNSFTI